MVSPHEGSERGHHARSPVGTQEKPGNGRGRAKQERPRDGQRCHRAGRWRGVPALRRSVSYPSPWPAGALDPFTAAAVGEEEEKAPAIRAGAEACWMDGGTRGSGNPPSLVWLCAPQRPSSSAYRVRRCKIIALVRPAGGSGQEKAPTKFAGAEGVLEWTGGWGMLGPTPAWCTANARTHD
jgi:hypothetical protein